MRKTSPKCTKNSTCSSLSHIPNSLHSAAIENKLLLQKTKKKLCAVCTAEWNAPTMIHACAFDRSEPASFNALHTILNMTVNSTTNHTVYADTSPQSLFIRHAWWTTVAMAMSMMMMMAMIMMTVHEPKPAFRQEPPFTDTLLKLVPNAFLIQRWMLCYAWTDVFCGEAVIRNSPLPPKQKELVLMIVRMECICKLRC